MNKYVVALGSSHYQGIDYLNKACSYLKSQRNVYFVSRSKIYENYSFYTLNKLRFLNCAVCIMAPFSPFALFLRLLPIEKALGKVTPYKNAPRTIDIDIVMGLGLSQKREDFEVPHKDYMNRDFFITPSIEALKKAKWPLPMAINALPIKNSLRLRAISAPLGNP